MPPKNPSAEAVGTAPALSTEETNVPDDGQISVSEEGGEVVSLHVLSEERQARLQELREQVASGTYKSDVREVAAKIVEASLRRRR
jgi:anti-sigma28 factor (negative regulator of flagellin synthesis)